MNVDEDEICHRAGDGDCVLTFYDMMDGWKKYRNEYGNNPDVCRIDTDAFHDMLTDEVLRSYFICEETVLMSRVVDVERRLECLDERLPANARGQLFGMAVVVDGEMDQSTALLHEPNYFVRDRSVYIDG